MQETDLDSLTFRYDPQYRSEQRTAREFIREAINQGCVSAVVATSEW